MFFCWIFFSLSFPPGFGAYHSSCEGELHSFEIALEILLSTLPSGCSNNTECHCGTIH